MKERMPRIIETSRFGALTVEDGDAVVFPKGIPGFDDHREWVIAGEDDDPIKWLQSVHDADVALPVTPPSVILDRYAPRFADEELEEVRLGSDENMMLLVVLSLPPGAPWDMTANLRAPIVLNHVKRIGKQIIALNEDYPLKAEVLPEPVRNALKAKAERPEDAAERAAAEPGGD